ncbi:MAG TPA: alpha/beta hydrolase [Caulobacteraceae bacterium]|jgi:pimeloyl-ACP methyl ester carboxylesterase|nr:alpha/beta hydrolase [Caulobacteraceae bacterium]
MAKAAVNGITLEYESFGDPKNTTVLLINGLGSQMTRWPEAFCQLLVARGLRAVRFDNRDVGLSTWLPAGAAYRTEDMAADCAGLLDHLGVAKAHIVGMSMGGMIAQTVASDFPERTLSLTTIMSNTGRPDLPQPTPEAWAVISQPAPDPKAGLEVFLDHQVKNAETIGSPAYPWPPGGLRERALAEYTRAFNPPGVARQMAAIRASGDRRPKVRTITAPTVVLHGADDPLVPVEGGRDTAACIPGAELRVIPGMGHDLPPALYSIFIEAIMRAVERAGARTPA